MIIWETNPNPTGGLTTCKWHVPLLSHHAYVDVATVAIEGALHYDDPTVHTTPLWLSFHPSYIRMYIHVDIHILTWLRAYRLDFNSSKRHIKDRISSVAVAQLLSGMSAVWFIIYWPPHESDSFLRFWSSVRNCSTWWTCCHHCRHRSGLETATQSFFDQFADLLERLSRCRPNCPGITVGDIDIHANAENNDNARELGDILAVHNSMSTECCFTDTLQRPHAWLIHNWPRFQ